MRIRVKLLVLIAVPLVLLALSAAVGFRDRSATIERAEDATAITDWTRNLHRSVLAIGAERLIEAGADLDQSTGAESADGTTTSAASGPEAITDSALEQLSATAPDAESQAAVANVQELVGEARTASTSVAEANRDRAIADLLALDRVTTIGQPSAATYNHAATGRSAVEFLDASERAWVAYVDQRGPVGDDAVTLAVALTEAETILADVEALAADQSDPALTAVFTGDSVRRLRELQTLAVADLARGERSLARSEVLDALVDFRADWTDVIADQDAALAQLVADEQSSAEAARSLFLLLALAGAFTLAALVFVIHRSIADPLERLTVRADEVAHTELPEVMDLLRNNRPVSELPEARPIPVTTEDEIGELVTAFNDVQTTAFRLAREQAIGRRNVSDMFINLGRRNQQLLQRILTQLSRLERQEEDPDTLRELFELDNAVTRMRRNAESLVALAGARTARQWSKPVAIDNAVRGALAEVEGYERVDITALEPVWVQGNVVADVTHLLAELLENAINFSEPSTMVMVSGHHDQGGYHITVVDNGIGMSVDELADYNSRITDPPPLERVPTRFLGFYVVGRLAEPHGISIRLSEAPTRGVMARVELPAALLSEAGAPVDNDGADGRTASVDDEAVPAPLRSAPADEPASPLEEQHDLDAELTAILGSAGRRPEPDDTSPSSPSTPSTPATQTTDGPLPTRRRAAGVASAPAPETAAPTATSPTSSSQTASPTLEASPLPTRGRAEPQPEPSAETDGSAADVAEASLPVRGRPQAPIQTDDLPTRNRSAQPEPATEVADVPLPTRNRSAQPDADANAGADADADATGGSPLPVRGGGQAQPDADELPTRGRRTTSGAKTDDDATSAPIAGKGATDHSERAAGDFSSMMSALSSGISRGLQDASTTPPPDPAPNSDSTEGDADD